MRIASGFQFADCPMCRCDYQAVRIDTYRNIDLRQDGTIFNDTYTPPPSSWGSVQSQTFPIWPASVGTGSSSSQQQPIVKDAFWNATLPNGQLSIIPDTGACGSITGAKVARAIVARAKQHGAKVDQKKLDKPFTVGGVGNGTQTCNWKLDVDLAVPYEDGTAGTYNWQPPIVEGTGEDLPGLLASIA